MLIDERQMTRFEARRSLRKIWIFILGFGILIPIGIALYAATGQRAALLPAGLGLAATIVLALTAAAPGAVYLIGGDGILLKKGGARRVVDFDELRGAAVLSEGEAMEALNSYLAPAIASERSLNLKAWIRSNAAYGNFIRFCSVPVVQGKTTFGSALNIVKFSSHTSGCFVMLKLTSGQELLLSPKDCDAFLARISAHRKLPDTSPASDYTPPEFAPDTEAASSRPRWLFVYSLVSFGVILVLVGIFVVVPAVRNSRPPQASGPAWEQSSRQPGEASMKTGWVDADTFRSRATVRLDTSRLSDEEAKMNALSRAAAVEWQAGLTGSMVGSYQAGSALEPSEEQLAALRRSIEELALGLAPRVVSRRANAELTEMTIVVDVAAPGLRDRVTSMLDGALKRTN
jgi:hypothetical protein